MGPVTPLLIGLGMSAATAATVSTIATVGAGILGAASAVAGGVAARNAANYQAQVATNNASLATQQAASALQSGAAQESASRMATTRRIAGAEAAQAANGVDVGVGSPVAVREGMAAVGDTDALMIRYNAAREAYGDQLQATSFSSQATLDKASGDQALLKGIIGAGSSFLGSASSLSGKWAGFGQAGIPGFGPASGSGSSGLLSGTIWGQ